MVTNGLKHLPLNQRQQTQREHLLPQHQRLQQLQPLSQTRQQRKQISQVEAQAPTRQPHLQRLHKPQKLLRQA